MEGRALVRRMVLQVGGLPRLGPGDTSEASAEPAPVEEQAQSPRQTSTRGPGQQPREVALSSEQAAAVEAMASPISCLTGPPMRSKARVPDHSCSRWLERVVYTLDRELRWVLKVGLQDGAFCAGSRFWPQVCRVEVPGLPAQDLWAFAVERMVAPIRPTPDGSFLRMCIMMCFWCGLRLPEGYLHPRDQGEHNWGYLGMAKYHPLTSLDVGPNWGTREHYGFPSLTRLVSFFRWFDQDAPTLSSKVRRWVSLHHASIPLLASLLLWELKTWTWCLSRLSST